jgi:hypothetical protein
MRRTGPQGHKYKYTCFESYAYKHVSTTVFLPTFRGNFEEHLYSRTCTLYSFAEFSRFGSAGDFKGIGGVAEEQKMRGHSLRIAHGIWRQVSEELAMDRVVYSHLMRMGLMEGKSTLNINGLIARLITINEDLVLCLPLVYLAERY